MMRFNIEKRVASTSSLYCACVYIKKAAVLSTLKRSFHFCTQITSTLPDTIYNGRQSDQTRHSRVFFKLHIKKSSMSVYLDTSFPHHLIHICLKLVNSLKVVVHNPLCTRTSRATAQASFFSDITVKNLLLCYFQSSVQLRYASHWKGSLYFELPK